MDNFKIWFQRLTFANFILLLLIFISYILWVPNGKWGTLSDAIIATFTFIIAYTTTLLLVAAYLAGNSWFDQFKYQKENEFIETLVSIFILNQIIREYNNRLSMYQDLIHKEEGDQKKFPSEAEGFLQSNGIDTSVKTYSISDIINFKKYYDFMQPINREKILESIVEINNKKYKAISLASTLKLDISSEELNDDISLLRNSEKEDDHSSSKKIIEKYADNLGLKDFTLVTTKRFEEYKKGSF